MNTNFTLKLGKMSLGTELTFDGNPNWHLFTTGRSGEGKSWMGRHLAMQVPGVGGRVIAIDHSGDFVEAKPKQGWDPASMEIINVRDKQYRLNPFHMNEGETLDDMVDRVVDLVDSGIRLSSGQWAYLVDAITEGYEDGEMNSMSDLVDKVRDDARMNETAARLLPKIRSLGRLIPSGEKEIDWKANTPGITIVDLSKIRDRAAKRILTEMLLNSICDLRMNGAPGKDETPLVVLLDECQLLSFREGSQEVRILREGRKFGVFGWFATQWINDRNALSALGQAGLHIYFRPAEEDLHKTALKLAHGDRKRVPECEKRLSRLQVGQFMYASGQRLIVSSPI